MRSKRARIGIGGLMIGLVLLMALIGFLLPSEAWLRVNLTSRGAPAGSSHLLGTDQLGRDIALRLLVGARTTVEMGLVATAMAFAIGWPIGHRARRSRWVSRGVLLLAYIGYIVPKWLLAPTWPHQIAAAA